MGIRLKKIEFKKKKKKKRIGTENRIKSICDTRDVLAWNILYRQDFVFANSKPRYNVSTLQLAGIQAAKSEY